MMITEFRNFGRTGVKVSPLCLGCMMFGGRTSAQDAYAMIDRAIESGINFLDTANVYSRGQSEIVTGEALKRNGKRSRIFLASKVHGVMADDDPNMRGNSRRHIIEQCEASLKRLQTDYLDLYQVHRPLPDTPIDETLRAMDDLVRAGKIRYIGTSTFAAWHLVEALWASKELGLNRVVCEQPPYNLLDRRIERELIPMAQTYDIALIPWSPLAGGLLSGKYSRDFKSDGQARYEAVDLNSIQKDRKVAAAIDIVESLKPIAEEKGCSLSQLALAWTVSKPGITSSIIGPRTMEQLEDNLAALEVTLSEADHARIDAIAPPGHMVSPFYTVHSQPHRFRI